MSNTTSESNVTAPALTHFFDIHVQMAPPVDVGQTRHGRRLVFAFAGGHFEGPYARGRVLLGADWQLLHSDGLAEIEVQCVIETHDGVPLQIDSRGYRHASPEVTARILAGERVADSDYYFRTTPRFTVAAGRHPELTRRCFVGVGLRRPNQAILRVFGVE